LDALPLEYREVLWLRDAEGLTAPEAAEALGDSVSAIKSRLHRARKALKDALLPVLAPALPAAGCPDVAEQLSKKLEVELSPDACAAMEAHLRKCTHCDAACEALKQALAVCRNSSAEPVPECVRRAVETALERYRDPARRRAR
jgi:RNA polymerase sigma-70 factor (ECF subfamily)